MASRWLTLVLLCACGSSSDADRRDAGAADGGVRDDGGPALDATAPGDGGADAGEASDAGGVDDDAGPSDGGADAGPPRTDCFVPMEVGAGGIPSGLAMSPDTTALFTYVATGNDLGVATNATGSWVQEQPFPGTNLHFFPSAAVAITDADAIHIAYDSGAPGFTNYATNASGTWTVEEQRFGTGDVPALVVDAAGAVHLVFGRSGGLSHARIDTAGWTIEPIVERTATELAAAIDAADRIRVAYLHDAEADGYADVFIGQQQPDGSWTERVLVDEGASESSVIRIALAPDDTTHVLYFRDGSIVHAADAPTVTPSPVTTADGQIDLAVDGDGAPHAAWGRFTYGLRHARLDSGGWSPTPIETTFLEGLLALERASDGEVHLLYAGQYDSARRVRRVVLCDPTP